MTAVVHTTEVTMWCREYAEKIARGEAERFHAVLAVTGVRILLAVLIAAFIPSIALMDRLCDGPYAHPEDSFAAWTLSTLGALAALLVLFA